MATDTRTRPTTTNTGDHDRFAHYIWAPNAKAVLTEAIINGTPVVALCGKTWVPSRDATKYPVCPDCDRIKRDLQT